MPIKDKIYQFGENKAQRVWVDVGADEDLSLEDHQRASHQARGALLKTTVVIPPHLEHKEAVMGGLGSIDVAENRKHSDNGEVRITFKPRTRQEAQVITTKIDEVLAGLGYTDITKQQGQKR